MTDYAIRLTDAKGNQRFIQNIERRRAFEIGEDAVCSGEFVEALLLKRINGKWSDNIDADAEHTEEFYA